MKRDRRDLFSCQLSQTPRFRGLSGSQIQNLPTIWYDSCIGNWGFARGSSLFLR